MSSKYINHVKPVLVFVWKRMALFQLRIFRATPKNWRKVTGSSRNLSPYHRALMPKWARLWSSYEDCWRCLKVFEGVEATLCFIGALKRSSSYGNGVEEPLLADKLDGAAAEKSLQSMFLPFWHAILCRISNSLSFSQAKYLWSCHRSLQIPRDVT